jgi:transcriptional regulator with XRE-family HTH domain
MVTDRLKKLREEREMSQGDIEKRTGLLRCYISRVENGHTIPSVETLEKFARALEVPMYRLFYDGEKAPKPLNLRAPEEPRRGDHKFVEKFRPLLSKMSTEDRGLLLATATKLAKSSPARKARKSSLN